MGVLKHGSGVVTTHPAKLMRIFRSEFESAARIPDSISLRRWAQLVSATPLAHNCCRER